MLKGIKVRLYLSDEQSNYMNSLIGSYRYVYNQCLDFCIENYKKDKTNTANRTKMSKYFHNTMRIKDLWLQEHNTKVLKQSILDLETAYKNFFKNGSGFPKFKAKHFSKQSVKFPAEAIAKDTFKNDKLNLTREVKNLKFKCSVKYRKYLYKNKESIRSITINKTKTGKFFASILIDGDLHRTVKQSNNMIGIDLGIKTLATFSNGTTIANPKWIHSNEKQLKKLQRQLSKKKLKSNNREKARLKLAKKYEKIKNQKQDFLHNLTSKIIDENQVIVLEDLNIKGMMKNHKLAKAIQELSLFEFRRQLEYKAKWYNRNLVFVDRFYPSSKTCSACGHINHDLTLKDRDYICPDCGIIMDRDLNASINILNEGLRIYKESLVNPRICHK